MILLSASEFWMGSNDANAEPDEKPFGHATGECRGIIRGGAYSYSPLQARTSYQGFEALETTCHDVGFRCAMDAVPKRK
jgi:formylglycine-generating enzyme required for sulfatase activity